MILRNR